MSRYSRRTFIKVAAATGLVAACGPTAQPGGASPSAAKGLSGSIIVSYPDELGKKPPYVEKAAQAVMSANANAKVNIDLQKISSGDYYTKLLLALQGGDVPDVIHVGGDRIGELADAQYIEPLDRYVQAWPDWKSYPEAIKQGATYKGKVW